MSIVPQTLPTTYAESPMLTQTSTTTIQDNHSSSSPLMGQQTVATVELQEAEGTSENDKKAVYRHPLFPLMALLFEKCERATQTPDCPSSDSFDVDIQAFVQHQEKDRKPFFSEDPELDGVMVKAIQVLRIHLLELEKVNELCKDFCSRYIACLKSKMQSEHLLRTEITPYEAALVRSSTQAQVQGQVQQVVTPSVITTMGNNVVIQQGLAQPAVSMGTLSQGQIVSGGTVYQMVHTPQGIVAQPIQIQAAPIQAQVATTPIIHGSTPLSQIGVVSTPVSTQVTTSTVTSQIPSIPTTLGTGSDDDDLLGKRKSKRGILPKSATQVMRSWLFQHIVHPYPTEDEKRQIAAQTNLTLLQVNNWFINARRRILQPMLDASNPEQAKVKKSKPQNRPLQRFWPESIANLQPQLPSRSTSQSPTQGSDTSTVTSSQQPSSETHIVVSAGAIISADGQLVSGPVTLEGIQGQHLSPMLSQVSTSPTLIIQNGDEEEEDLHNDGLELDNSSDSSSLVE